MENEFSFLSLLLITGLAAFVPLLASRFKKLRIPIVVGEIMAGMIFGKSGLNWIEPSPALEGALHFPAAFDMLTDHADGVEVSEVKLNNPQSAGRLLRQIRLPGDALILSLRRNGEVLVPHGNTRLRQGDLLMLVGHQDSLAKSLDMLNPGTL